MPGTLEDSHLKLIAVILTTIGIVMGGMQYYTTQTLNAIEKHVGAKNEDQDKEIDAIKAESIRRQAYIDQLGTTIGNVQTLTEIVKQNTESIREMQRELRNP